MNGADVRACVPIARGAERPPADLCGLTSFSRPHAAEAPGGIRSRSRARGACSARASQLARVRLLVADLRLRFRRPPRASATSRYGVAPWIEMLLISERAGCRLPRGQDLPTPLPVTERPEPQSSCSCAPALSRDLEAAAAQADDTPEPPSHHGDPPGSGERSRAAGGRTSVSCCVRLSRRIHPLNLGSRRVEARVCHFTSPLRRYPPVAPGHCSRGRTTGCCAAHELERRRSSGVRARGDEDRAHADDSASFLSQPYSRSWPTARTASRRVVGPDREGPFVGSASSSSRPVASRGWRAGGR